jgi:hypothetical protein
MQPAASTAAFSQFLGTSPSPPAGAITEIVHIAAHERMTMGEPKDATPPPQFTSPTGQKTMLGQ